SCGWWAVQTPNPGGLVAMTVWSGTRRDGSRPRRRPGPRLRIPRPRLPRLPKLGRPLGPHRLDRHESPPLLEGSRALEVRRILLEDVSPLPPQPLHGLGDGPDDPGPRLPPQLLAGARRIDERVVRAVEEPLEPL